MPHHFLITKEYKDFIHEIKQSVLRSRNTAVLKVNSELIQMYYTLGKRIAEKQKETQWGDKLIGQMEKDLKLSFPDVRGFSRRNLMYMRSLYEFFGENVIVPQLVAQLPWGHIRVILDKIKTIPEAEFYLQKTIEYSWSRVILSHQIDLHLYARQGKALSNFHTTIPPEDAELLRESFKESYVLDFLELSKNAKERDLEMAAVNNISKFILELGKGFAFVGKQYKLVVGGQEFFMDLLFYHYILKRFVVIELKTTEFKPEYVGKIGFYLTAVDRDMKKKEDKRTIGLIICQSKNNTVVEYALSNSHQPTGVSEYKLLSELPEELREYLPSSHDLQSL